jgi:hypothetical protein
MIRATRFAIAAVRFAPFKKGAPKKKKVAHTVTPLNLTTKSKTLTRTKANTRTPLTDKVTVKNVAALPAPKKVRTFGPRTEAEARAAEKARMQKLDARIKTAPLRRAQRKLAQAYLAAHSPLRHTNYHAIKPFLLKTTLRKKQVKTDSRDAYLALAQAELLITTKRLKLVKAIRVGARRTHHVKKVISRFTSSARRTKRYVSQ